MSSAAFNVANYVVDEPTAFQARYEPTALIGGQIGSAQFSKINENSARIHRVIARCQYPPTPAGCSGLLKVLCYITPEDNNFLYCVSQEQDYQGESLQWSQDNITNFWSAANKTAAFNLPHTWSDSQFKLVCKFPFVRTLWENSPYSEDFESVINSVERQGQVAVSREAPNSDLLTLVNLTGARPRDPPRGGPPGGRRPAGPRKVEDQRIYDLKGNYVTLKDLGFTDLTDAELNENTNKLTTQGKIGDLAAKTETGGEVTNLGDLLDGGGKFDIVGARVFWFEICNPERHTKYIIWVAKRLIFRGAEQKKNPNNINASVKYTNPKEPSASLVISFPDSTKQVTPLELTIDRFLAVYIEVIVPSFQISLEVNVNFPPLSASIAWNLLWEKVDQVSSRLISNLQTDDDLSALIPTFTVESFKEIILSTAICPNRPCIPYDAKPGAGLVKLSFALLQDLRARVKKRGTVTVAAATAIQASFEKDAARRFKQYGLIYSGTIGSKAFAIVYGLIAQTCVPGISLVSDLPESVKIIAQKNLEELFERHYGTGNTDGYGL